MSYSFQVMTQKQAEHIANTWKYDGEYSFYDLTEDEEDLAEFLDENQRGSSTFSVFQEGKKVGFYSFQVLPDGTVDIGLGMEPSITGKGHGKRFTESGLKFAQAKYSPDAFSLSVATFNERAINVYKKVGFKALETFTQETNGSRYEFLKMKYDLHNRE
ncbi:GNAT family N-acetyltransferase [Rossellomorea sp. SC111]|uniref:GNAT family N-acetyltransferase n=1 Tax=Rossellomorea sp. SC111 TaxID=2968985 RepID=UPI00215A21EB|nr:GNAT family N-acetyltransferase [Rossellomorea sp. SC111]MCR8850322.1 GNAT family N-acetyltransferase [Rossellomorea sp. SC111]